MLDSLQADKDVPVIALYLSIFADLSISRTRRNFRLKLPHVILRLVAQPSIQALHKMIYSLCIMSCCTKERGMVLNRPLAAFGGWPFKLAMQ